jgi:hypothetical protein
MKKLLSILILVICSVAAYSQVRPDSLRMPINKDGAVEISEVVVVKDKKTSDLFSSALQFVAENYNSPSTVTKLSDKASGKLLISTFFIVNENFHIKCMLEIDVKDGRYKYKFKDFTYQVVIESLTDDLAPKETIFDPVFPNKHYSDPETYTRLANGTLDHIKVLINRLKITMSKTDSF